MRTGSLIFVYRYRGTKIEYFKEILIEKTPGSDYRPKINFFSFLQDEEEAKKVASDFLADSVFMQNDFELSSSLKPVAEAKTERKEKTPPLIEDKKLEKKEISKPEPEEKVKKIAVRIKFSAVNFFVS